MKLAILFVLAIAALHAGAAQNIDFSTGHRYYEDAEFGKAAAHFQIPCRADGNAEACYWTGLSYERLADTRTPFGCGIDAKARQYLRQAVRLGPERRLYREAFFDFLLDTADCSRTALQEAADLLAATPEGGNDYDRMRSHLEEAMRQKGSVSGRLARMLLVVPRAAYRAGALPGAVLTNSMTGGLGK
jgi:hypothetical protein